MANPVIDLAQLLQENPHGPTDFILTSEKYTWKVHSKLLIKKSSYFGRLRIYDTMKLEVDEVTIDQKTSYEIARLIQYLYLDDYAYGAGSLPSARQYHHYLKYRRSPDQLVRLLPSLSQLVPFTPLSSDSFYDEQDNDQDRLEVIVDIEMTKIATEYELEGLTDLIQENLVSFLEADVRKKIYPENIAAMYPKIHQAMRGSLKSDQCLADRMVEGLMAYNFENFKKAAPFTTYISPNEAIDRSLTVLRFQKQVARYISQGGMFADPEWPLQILEEEKVEPTDFGSRSRDFPVDGAERTHDWMD